MERTDIAHHEWDKRWKTDEGRADWLRPDAEVLEIIPMLRAQGAKDALDLGCGVGRHALLLAQEGFRVTAMDGSQSGLDFLAEEAARQGVDVLAHCHEMTTLPFEDQSFDFLLAWNVIYHGSKDIVQQVINEIHRVLRPGGCAQLTMLSDRNDETRTGQCISEGTYINPGFSDKAHPHYYCNEQQLRKHFGQFRIVELSEKEHARPGSFHWHLFIENPS